MYVYYYIYQAKIYRVCCRGNIPGRLSPIWEIPSSCAWLVPGTSREE